jgi:hypothetical protein
MLRKFRQWFKDKLEPGALSYGILKKCSRCVYAKSAEPVLIYSRNRGPRIMFYNGRTYVRRGNCTGFSRCGKCFEQIENLDKSLRCQWIEF